MATAAKFRIDVAIHDLLMNSAQSPPSPAEAKGLTLPTPIFPQFPERLNDPGPDTPPEKRKWGVKDVYRMSCGWLFPYVRSRVRLGKYRSAEIRSEAVGCHEVNLPAPLLLNPEPQPGLLLQRCAGH
jgi:hypothetical protein